VTVLRKVFLLATLIFFVGATSVYASHIFRSRAELTGSQEVPPVNTAADGKGNFRVNQENDTIQFRLRVDDASKVTQAHLHCAPVGENGPVVAFLFGNVPGGFDVDGELADFTLTDANIVANTCSPVITTMDQLISAIQAGNIYANVHTVAHPNGEIRGQLSMD
jgi:hypothetical protein